MWKETEDEFLKAAVMKYGTNQWARISTFLGRKTARQCKARWFGRLGPSIRKANGSIVEDQKLLQVVNHTSSQCLERKENSLHAAYNDPRKIDANSELMPDRPDPIAGSDELPTLVGGEI